MQYTLLQEHCAFISYPLWVGQEKNKNMMKEYIIKRMHDTKYKILTLATIDMQENKKRMWNQSSKFIENKSYHTKSMELPYK
jgi:hypothetical protein